MVDKLGQLRRIISESPGAPEFVELAQLLLKSQDTRPEARDVCFKGLAEDPKNLRGRLVLARLFYLDGLTEFCIRELLEIQKQSSPKSLERLLEMLGHKVSSYLRGYSQSENSSSTTPPDSSPQEVKSEVVAEIDIEAEFFEALEDLDTDS